MYKGYCTRMRTSNPDNPYGNYNEELVVFDELPVEGEVFVMTEENRLAGCTTSLVQSVQEVREKGELHKLAIVTLNSTYFIENITEAE